MKTEEILKILNKCSTLNENYQIKYIDPMDYGKLANILEEALLEELQKQLAISRVSNCGDKHLSNICDKEGHQMSELWYVNEDRIPFQLEHSDKCCICGYENNSI